MIGLKVFILVFVSLVVGFNMGIYVQKSRQSDRLEAFRVVCLPQYGTSAYYQFKCDSSEFNAVLAPDGHNYLLKSGIRNDN